MLSPAGRVFHRKPCQTFFKSPYGALECVSGSVLTAVLTRLGRSTPPLAQGCQGWRPVTEVEQAPSAKPPAMNLESSEQ